MIFFICPRYVDKNSSVSWKSYIFAMELVLNGQISAECQPGDKPCQGDPVCFPRKGDQLPGQNEKNRVDIHPGLPVTFVLTLYPWDLQIVEALRYWSLMKFSWYVASNNWQLSQIWRAKHGNQLDSIGSFRILRANFPLHPRSLTVRPWKMMVGRRSFPIGKVTFQGRAVKLREGNILILKTGGVIEETPFPRVFVGPLGCQSCHRSSWALSGFDCSNRPSIFTSIYTIHIISLSCIASRISQLNIMMLYDCCLHFTSFQPEIASILKFEKSFLHLALRRRLARKIRYQSIVVGVMKMMSLNWTTEIYGCRRTGARDL